MGPLSRMLLNKMNCFKCDRMLNHPFVVCVKCNELQRIPKLNYFQLFNMDKPSQFPNNIKQTYIKLQSMSHPDRHNSNESAQNMSAFISNGYNTLNDPFKRAEYALQLQNVIINDHDKVPQCFLMQVMELQEDQDSENAELIRNMQMDYQRQFWQLFEKEDFKGAKDVLLKWKFLNKI